MDKTSTLKTTMRVFKQLPKPWYFIFGTICTLLDALTAITIGYLLAQFVDNAIAKNMDRVTSVFVWIIIMQIIRSGAIWFGRVAREMYSENGAAYIRHEIIKHLSVVSMKEADKVHTADWISRFTNDLNRFRLMTSNTLTNMLLCVASGVLAFVYLSSLSLRLTLAAMIFTPLMILVGAVLSKPLSSLSQLHQERLSSIVQTSQDSLMGIEVTKAFKLEDNLENKLFSAVDNSVQSAKSLVRRSTLLEWVPMGIGILPHILLYGLGGYWVIQGHLTAGSLAAFASLLSNLTNPIAQLPGLVGQLKADTAVVERIYELLELPAEVGGDKTIPELNSEEPLILIDNLTFQYDNSEKAVLQNIDLEILAGESVAIVGPSGSGKSTLLKLLVGLYTQFNGQMKIMGHPLHEWDLDALREHIAIVPQDPFLLPDTVLQNIRYGKQEASDEDVERAAVLAQAHQFITTLPQDYSFNVGEGGNNLSGGQRQRISTARAIVKDSPLIIFDEPTSALDNELELSLSDVINTIATTGKTIITVAHRLSTIVNADKIVVLDDGKIVEQGCHDELLEKQGLYWNFYNKQFESEVEEAVS